MRSKKRRDTVKGKTGAKVPLRDWNMFGGIKIIAVALAYKECSMFSIIIRSKKRRNKVPI